MGSRLQQVLRSLCFNTGWKYAVYWKLKHRSRMMFTWEDAYYDGNQYPEKKLFKQTAGSLIEGPYSHDLLGLAVENMSYQVYSLGEGVVGQVAVSGKHSWIFSDEHVVDSASSSEYCGGWQTQFSAGIKTIAVVAVIPHGVVQLGSLHKIAEDLKLVDHLRNIFSEIQDSLAGCIPSLRRSNTENSCLSDTCTKVSDSSVQDSVAKLEASLHKDEANLCSQLFSPLGQSVNQSHISPPMGGFPSKTLKKNMPEGAEMPGNEISLPLSSENILTRQLQQEEIESLNNTKCSGETNDLRDLGKRSEIRSTPSVKNVGTDNNSNKNNSTLLTDSSQMITSDLPFEMHFSPFSFCAGYELYEALGPSFQRQNYSVWEPEKSNSDMTVDISDGIGSCSLLMENSDMHLLEAVVAKVGSHIGYDTEIEKSCRESLLTAEKTPCNSIGTIGSFDRDTSSSLNSVTCGVESLKGFSSASSSRGSEHLERARVPVKINRKRARHGESCRPKPRDRQLIQDRIKELRELVPNGSKCSIDSLLERIIKHMMFLQSVTKHAEKLHKCSASKMLSKECGQFLEIAETIRSLGLTILKGMSEAYGDQTWMCFVVENNRSMHRMDVLWSLMQLLQPKISN